MKNKKGRWFKKRGQERKKKTSEKRFSTRNKEEMKVMNRVWGKLTWKEDGHRNYKYQTSFTTEEQGGS